MLPWVSGLLLPYIHLHNLVAFSNLPLFLLLRSANVAVQKIQGDLD